MSLKKRVKELERFQKQSTCTHSYREIYSEKYSTNSLISSTCSWCGKEISRTGTGKIDLAVETLRNFLLGKSDNETSTNTSQ